MTSSKALFHLMATSALAVCASTALADSGSFTLTAYTSVAQYSTSAFSFRARTQDPDIARNKYEILYQPSNEFETEMVVGDVGSIVDLGAISCADIRNYEQSGPYPGLGHGGYPYKLDRKLNPMFWITYSEAWDKLSKTRSNRAEAKLGHCYIVHQASHDGVTVAAFHVRSLDAGKSVTIDEVEVFETALFRDERIRQ
jgi:hypothetical protein